jgi:hypothetical protein
MILIKADGELFISLRFTIGLSLNIHILPSLPLPLAPPYLRIFASTFAFSVSVDSICVLYLGTNSGSRQTHRDLRPVGSNFYITGFLLPISQRGVAKVSLIQG